MYIYVNIYIRTHAQTHAHSQIMALGQTRKWEEGEDLFAEGDTANSLFVIEQGEVEVFYIINTCVCEYVLLIYYIV